MQAGGAPTFRQLPHILFSESIIPNGQKIARGISSVGKFRDAKRIDKAGSVPCNKGERNDARFIHNKSPLFSLRRSCKKRASGQRKLPIRKHRKERENGIASAVPFSHFSIDAVTFDISKAPMPL